jgi:peptidoglycan/xylan/chitin deacetylase (PgdA/CDA1 family)
VLGPELLTASETMPPRTLCLTYDDGPGATAGEGRGPRTLPLAQYLAVEGIRATFFMCGKHIAELPEAPSQVRGLGHLVGNHTWHHWHLPELAATGGDLVGELATTDSVLDLPPDEPVFVRPPYGDWSVEVAAVLNAAPGTGATRVGPVGWDVDAEDWALYRRRVAPDTVALAVLEASEAAGRGIVLFPRPPLRPGPCPTGRRRRSVRRAPATGPARRSR